MKNDDLKEMTFIDHLEELRWHVIRSVIAIVVLAVVAFVEKRILFHEIILGPSRPDFWTYKMMCQLAQIVDQPFLCVEQLNFTIQSRNMTGQFTTHLSISILAGFVIAFPYVFWELWRFIAPGLYHEERKITRWAVLSVSTLFLTGILFGYYIVAPLSINFLANYQIDESIINEFDLLSYIEVLTMMVLACGLMFQLPMVVYALSKAGIVTPHLMRHFRRHAAVVILLIAAILTPSPDVMSQLIVAIPIYLLYELSIFVSAYVERQKLRSN
ncbi:twin-arginine translocase subunit TatC [Flexibacter flexilis]|nr:twin-arginine translocase subunit TatC [Flexibacter flexilis]